MTGQADSLLCFVVMVMKASWKNMFDNTNDRDRMLKIQQIVTDSGKESLNCNFHLKKKKKRGKKKTKKNDRSISHMLGAGIAQWLEHRTRD